MNELDGFARVLPDGTAALLQLTSRIANHAAAGPRRSILEAHLLIGATQVAVAEMLADVAAQRGRPIGEADLAMIEATIGAGIRQQLNGITGAPERQA